MSLYDKTSPRARAHLERHKRAMGVEPDRRPRCYHCDQLADMCLCGGGIAALDHLA